MKSTHITLLLFVIVWVSPALGETVQVRLKANPTMAYRPIVRLSDIAEVKTRRPSLKKAAEALDILEWPQGDTELTISNNMVYLRMQLGLPEASLIEVTGANEVNIAAATNAAKLPAVPNAVMPRHDDRTIITQLQSQLADAWSVEPVNVRVRLLQPIPKELQIAKGPEAIDRIDTVIPSLARTGNLQAKLLGYRGEQLVTTSRILVEAQLFARIAVARSELPRGTVLTHDNLDESLQPIRYNQKITTVDALIDKTLITTVRRGQPVETRHLSRIRSRRESTVRARDTVRLTAKRGSLNVTITDAIALQSGAVGDQIRVRNPRSKKVLTARIVGPGHLEVDMR